MNKSKNRQVCVFILNTQVKATLFNLSVFLLLFLLQVQTWSRYLKPFVLFNQPSYCRNPLTTLCNSNLKIFAGLIINLNQPVESLWKGEQTRELSAHLNKPQVVDRRLNKYQNGLNSHLQMFPSVFKHVICCVLSYYTTVIISHFYGTISFNSWCQIQSSSSNMWYFDRRQPTETRNTDYDVDKSFHS